MIIFVHLTIALWFILYFNSMGTVSLLLGPPGTALHRPAGVQHLVLKHGLYYSLIEEDGSKVQKRATCFATRAQTAHAQQAAFLADVLTDLQHVAACAMLRWHKGADQVVGSS